MKFTASEDDAGKRLDVFALEYMPQLSRSSVRKLVDDGKVLVNDETAKASYKIRGADHIEVTYDIGAAGEVPDIELPILYEDNDCMVINKPIGVLTHSKGAFNPEATIASFLQQKVTFPAAEEPEDEATDTNAREGIVHRLDRATSGVIICAKTPEALKHLQKQFNDRKAHKTYVAVIEGALEPEHAIIDLPIERNPKKPQTFRVGPQGKESQTTYKVLETNGQHSLVELKPKTGRTHQLRVHLHYLKHPIVGDTFYDGAAHDRLLLHAYQLEITLPNKERKTFTAEIPDEFRAILDQ